MLIFITKNNTFKITLTKASNANVYMDKQFYISFNIILNKRFLIFKTQGLYCHELVSCKWVNLPKTQILGWKLGWKAMLEVTGTQPGIFRGRTSFLEQKHFDKHFMHDIQKEGLHREKLSCFLSKIFLKLHFKRELNQ